MSKIIRTFIAINFSEIILEKIYSSQKKIEAVFMEKFKFEQMEKFHITLKFIGNIDADMQLESAVKIMKETTKKFYAFDLKIDFTIGAFPNLKNSNILWFGVNDSSGTLLAMAEFFNGAFKNIGIPFEMRRFHPHITIARKIKFKNALTGNELRLMNEMNSKKETITLPVHEISLMESKDGNYKKIITVDLLKK